MRKTGGTYVPALGYRILTPLYDVLARTLLPERSFKQLLVEQAAIGPGDRVLDLGCGTGTLAILVKRTQPTAVVVGVDGDPDILALARRKIERAGLTVGLDRALASQLPYDSRSFDRVLSSLVFHHLSSDVKRVSLREIHRVLRPGGQLHVADWGAPASLPTRWASFLVQEFDASGTTRDNYRGLLPSLTVDAGFAPPEETTHFNTIFGTIRLFRALKVGDQQVCEREMKNATASCT